MNLRRLTSFLFVLLAFVGFLSIGDTVHAVSMDRFWNSAGSLLNPCLVGGARNWQNTGCWSTTSGGLTGASVPDRDDQAIFDSLSFSTSSVVNFAAGNVFVGSVQVTFGNPVTFRMDSGTSFIPRFFWVNGATTVNIVVASLGNGLSAQEFVTDSGITQFEVLSVASGAFEFNELSIHSTVEFIISGDDSEVRARSIFGDSVLTMDFPSSGIGNTLRLERVNLRGGGNTIDIAGPNTIARIGTLYTEATTDITVSGSGSDLLIDELLINSGTTLDVSADPGAFAKIVDLNVWQTSDFTFRISGNSTGHIENFASFDDSSIVTIEMDSSTSENGTFTFADAEVRGPDLTDGNFTIRASTVMEISDEFGPSSTTGTCTNPPLSDSGDWTSPTNAFLDDGNLATKSASSGMDGTSCQEYFNFGINLPQRAVVKSGIIRIEANVTPVDPGAPTIRLRVYDTGGTTACEKAPEPTDSLTVFAFDFDVDCDSVAELFDPAFLSMVRLMFQTDVDGEDREYAVDYVSIQLNYTLNPKIEYVGNQERVLMDRTNFEGINNVGPTIFCNPECGDFGNNVNIVFGPAPSFHATLFLTDSEPPGPNCANGGQKFQSGIDDGDPSGTPDNGFLEAGEVDSTAFVCDGIDGATGPTGPQGPPGESGGPITDDQAIAILLTFFLVLSVAISAVSKEPGIGFVYHIFAFMAGVSLGAHLFTMFGNILLTGIVIGISCIIGIQGFFFRETVAEG